MKNNFLNHYSGKKVKTEMPIQNLVKVIHLAELNNFIKKTKQI
jgi:hypothetical protein